MAQIQAGSRVRFVGKTLRRYVAAGDETTALYTEWNARQGAHQWVISSTRHISEESVIRVWPAELEVVR